MLRTRWAAIGAAVAVTLGAGGLGIARAAVDSGDKPVYVSLEQPCRLADTRPANQIGPKNTPISAGESNAYEIQVTGESGDCADESGPAVPADAVGVALNVTAIVESAPSGRSYFTVYPADAPLPGTSNLNFLDGQAPFPNKVDVGLSPDGKIKIYNHDGTAHVAVDVFGYYVDHNHDDRYYEKGEVDAALSATAFSQYESLAGPASVPGLETVSTVFSFDVEAPSAGALDVTFAFETGQSVFCEVVPADAGSMRIHPAGLDGADSRTGMAMYRITQPGTRSFDVDCRVVDLLGGTPPGGSITDLMILMTFVAEPM